MSDDANEDYVNDEDDEDDVDDDDEGDDDGGQKVDDDDDGDDDKLQTSIITHRHSFIQGLLTMKKMLI